MSEQTTAPAHNAKNILVEALDTIKATFWIQGQEAIFAGGVYLGGEEGWDWSDWDALDKAIEVEADDQSWSVHEGIRGPQSGKVKVTGVCSIGALALANVTLYDEPYTRWTTIAERDFETWKAGQALAQVILEDNPRWLDQGPAGDIIATWNDTDGRTREQIIADFEKALDHPLLTAQKVYEPTLRNEWGVAYSRVYFASEEAAQAFLDTPSPLREMVCSYLGSDRLTVEEYVHDSMVHA